MDTQMQPLLDFFTSIGANSVPHTKKTYLAHVANVYKDLQSWGCSEEVCKAGFFHSIYGTQRFQGFTLSLERRGELHELIGERAERLAYYNCAMFRPTFDETVLQKAPPYLFEDRITGETIELRKADFDDLCAIHLCDWLEQVARSELGWGNRRESYRQMADNLGGAAKAAYERVFADEPVAS